MLGMEMASPRPVPHEVMLALSERGHLSHRPVLAHQFDISVSAMKMRKVLVCVRRVNKASCSSALFLSVSLCFPAQMLRYNTI